MNTENNKIVAEFLCTTQKTEDLEDCYILNGKAYHIIDLKFHTDWNWLMQVVEKIYQTNLYYDKYIDFNSSMFLSGKIELSTKIEAVYNACLEFIQWYNRQEK